MRKADFLASRCFKSPSALIQGMTISACLLKFSTKARHGSRYRSFGRKIQRHRTKKATHAVDSFFAILVISIQSDFEVSRTILIYLRNRLSNSERILSNAADLL